MSSRTRLRWSPPPPLVRIRTIEQLFRRQLAFEQPEAFLVAALLAHTIGDCLDRHPVVRAGARHFMVGDDLEVWCDLVGLNAEFVLLVAQRAGYLVPEDRLWAQGRTSALRTGRCEETVRA